MATWYFNNATNDGLWETAANWWSSSSGTGDHPAAAPWTTAATKDDNTAPVYDYMGDKKILCTIGHPTNDWVITGYCTIDRLENSREGDTIGKIYSGTFPNLSMINRGEIYGGTFSGDDFVNNDGTIYGGTFSGADFFSNGGYINGGTFSGERLVNDGTIYGGTFSGDNFENGEYGTINGGTFTGNDGANDGIIYGGTFSGGNWLNTVWGTIDGDTVVTGIDWINDGTTKSGTFSGEGWLNRYGNVSCATFTGGFYSLDGGITWVYSPTSVHVNKPADIRKGVKIAETVTGTAEVPTAAETVTGAKTSTAGMASVDGTYPTTAASKAEQLADDKSVVVAAKGDIRKDVSLLGTTGNDRGTLDTHADDDTDNESFRAAQVALLKAGMRSGDSTLKPSLLTPEGDIKQGMLK